MFHVHFLSSFTQFVPQRYKVEKYKFGFIFSFKQNVNKDSDSDFKKFQTNLAPTFST